MFAAEAIRQQRPEHHGREQVEHAEPDEEDLAAACAHRFGCEHQQRPEPGQAQCEEAVGGADEMQAPEAAHQPAEHRVHQQGDQRGADEQPADAVDAAFHSQRIACRPQEHQRGQDAEEEQSGDQHRRQLAAAEVEQARDACAHRRRLSGTWPRVRPAAPCSTTGRCRP